MKALIYEGPKEMNIREVSVPSLTSGDVLIKVEWAGICGSELSGFLGQNSLRKPPLIMGHEISGTIEKFAGNVKGLKRGDRVTVNPLISCGTCSYCTKGQNQLCENRGLIGAAYPGGFGEYLKVPATAIVPLPDTVSFEEGVLVEPLACAMRVIELASVRSKDTVLIMGMGPIGLFVLAAMQKRGVKTIYAVDRNEKRLEMAETLGAIPLEANGDLRKSLEERTNGQGVDVAIDAVGLEGTRQQCIHSCKNGGRVVFTGLHEADSSLPINEVIRKEIKMFGSFAYSNDNFLEALHFIKSEEFLLKEWLVKAPLEEGQKWFETLLANPGGVAKVLLSPNYKMQEEFK
ncbi:galactitol-1-phosphate 5-dehydrogenase [Peribacillus muralis]|uniref:zinc-dependent alcohol dehydrogenase n=1 Tax=Peribacillus muralis TaxID=264697 RepID=UPI001F4E2006|nr:galactitol-1-phosphate 5-dehydrogenase [Peribacillus muralis]MCK1992932.1 galactitol-1-phosphate 5-dehydrogenase [Peribacillus muralis]MCK2013487.1 galactitol-1-phosphate 5-dehydrogenase [Peribacillus muralis]